MAERHSTLVKDETLRLKFARSEVAAVELLARSMHDQGSHDATTEAFSAGFLVSLGAQRYINRLMWTELDLDEDDLARTIDFFTSQDMPSSIQISSDCDSATIDLFRLHDFAVDWQRCVLAGPAARRPGGHADTHVTVGTVGDDDLDDWLSVLAEGNDATARQARATSDEFARAAHGIGGALDLLARVDGRPAACGSLQPVDGVGWLGGAATVPEFRRRGLQRALLDIRIDMASRGGHEFVAATAVPGSTSMRNLERAGLVLVDTQTVWTRRL